LLREGEGHEPLHVRGEGEGGRMIWGQGGDCREGGLLREGEGHEPLPPLNPL
jgi:hypothetical protein